MTLRFLGFPHTGAYQAQGMAPWHADEVREVEEALAERLLRDFPAFFVPEFVPIAIPDADLSPPPVTPEFVSVAISDADPSPPPVAPVSPSLDAGAALARVLDDHWRRVVAEVEAGEHDELLDGLAEADDRPSVLRAVRARLSTLEG